MPSHRLLDRLLRSGVVRSGLGFTGGIGERSLALGLGGATLFDKILQGMGGVGIEEIVKRLKSQKEKLSKGFDVLELPKAARISGNVVGELANFALPGAVAQKALVGAAGGASLMGRAGTALTRVHKGKRGLGAAAQLAFDVPIDVAIGASDREESIAGLLSDFTDSETLDKIADSPLKRGLVEALGGLALGGPLVGAFAQGAKPLVREASRGAIGAGVGAGVGAVVDKEDRVRGAVLGGVAGAATPTLIREAARLNRIGAVPLKGTFFSRLEESVSGASFASAPSEQWRGFLNKQAVSKGEIEFTGLGEFLDSRKGQKVTREEIQGFLGENGIKLEETVLGNPRSERALSFDDDAAIADVGRSREQARQEISQWLDSSDDSGRRVEEYLSIFEQGSTSERVLSRQIIRDNAIPAEATAGIERHLADLGEARVAASEAESALARANPETKFDSYTQPGGENYREVLIQLGDRGADGPAERAWREWMRGIDEKYGPNTPVDRLTPEEDAARTVLSRAANAELQQSTAGFTSPHWDEPNVLVHVRLKDRTFRNPVTGKEEKVLFVEEVQSDWHQKGRQKGYQEPREPLPKRFATVGRDGAIRGTHATRAEAQAVVDADPTMLQVQEYNPAAGSVGAVPDAPFKRTDDWIELGFKRVFAEAAEGGYDRVSWASGKQAAENFDLRKQIDRIDYNGTDLRAWKDGEAVISQTGIRPEDLPDIIGKEPAQRLMGQEAAPGTLGRTNTSREVRSRQLRTIQGNDLAVGGEGMVEFYDRRVPSALRKYGKQIGGLEIEPVRMPDLVEGIPRADPTNLSIPITPATRDIILNKGQRLGFATSSIVQALGGAGVGAVVGASQGDDSGERIKKAILGAFIGGAGIAGVRAALKTETGPGREAIERIFDIADSRGAGLDAADVDPEDFVKLSTFALDVTGESRLHDEVQRIVAKTGAQFKDTVTFKDLRQAAASLGVPDALLAKDATRLNGTELLAIRNVMSSNIDEMVKITNRLSEVLPLEEKEVLRQTLQAIEAQNDVLFSKFTRARTQMGRNLNSLKALANRTLDESFWLTKADELLGTMPLLAEHQIAIRKLINAGDKAGLVRFMQTIRVAGKMEKLVTLWKAGLLSSPTTHWANILGNTTMQFLEISKDATAAMWDRILLSHITGTRVKSGVSIDTVAASIKAVKKGLEEARLVMQGVPLDDALAKWDVSRQVNFDNPILDAYTKGIFRALGAMDRIFRSMAMMRSLTEQAQTIAKLEGLSGIDLERRVRQLVDSPPDWVAMRAVEDAEIAVFQNKGIIAGAGQSLRTAIKTGANRVLGETAGSLVGAATDVIAPFIRTPANVATRAIEYSPLGFLGAGVQMIDLVKRSSRQLDDAGRRELLRVQRQIADTMGRATVGSAAVLYGYMLHQRDLMTAGYPRTDTRERNVWRLTGRLENAILLLGKWRSVERISPLGNLMALGAHLSKLADDPENGIGTLLVGGTASIGRTTLDQSFLSGIQGVLDVVSDPERSASSYLRRTAGSVVPNIVRRAARAFDPVIREERGQGPFAPFKSRIPFLRSGLPARTDAFGEEIRGEGGIGEIFDPFSSRKDLTVDDPVRAEVARVGASISLPSSRLFPRNSREDLVVREALGEATQAIVERIISTMEYQDMPRTARSMIAETPELVGVDPDELSDMLQREMIENAVRSVRSKITRELGRVLRPTG